MVLWIASVKRPVLEQGSIERPNRSGDTRRARTGASSRRTIPPPELQAKRQRGQCKREQCEPTKLSAPREVQSNRIHEDHRRPRGPQSADADQDPRRAFRSRTEIEPAVLEMSYRLE